MTPLLTVIVVPSTFTTPYEPLVADGIVTLDISKSDVESTNVILKPFVIDALVPSAPLNLKVPLFTNKPDAFPPFFPIYTTPFCVKEAGSNSPFASVSIFISFVYKLAGIKPLVFSSAIFVVVACMIVKSSVVSM